MKRITPENWIPADGMNLESNALSIVKLSGNNLVVAGPGAGKTELLAQKAAFLLQTNSCKFPYKILAISFKRDAAYNLKERVQQRCGEELSRRFDSLTFDSFAKQLLDRFKNALPIDFRIKEDYNIIFDERYILDKYYALDTLFYKNNTKDSILELHNSQFPHFNNCQAEKIRQAVWIDMLNNSSELSFKMIMRLAEYIINTNPKIKKYLQQTYKYIFLDEFQDTTGIQYDLFKSCFLDSQSYFTAVGDDKQRIMLWAGAQNTIFDDFILDTKASRVPLTMNFRCAPRLVKLLNYLTEYLLDKKDFATPSPKWDSEQGECTVFIFENYEEEMKILLQDIKKQIKNDKVEPRNICILVKQQLSKYVGDLIEYFNTNGVSVRDESLYQDLLTEELPLYLINMLYTIFDKNNSKAKQESFAFLSNLHTEFEDHQLLKLESDLSKSVKQIRKKYIKNTINIKEEEIIEIIDQVIELAGEARIKAHFPSYKNEDLFSSLINRVKREIVNNSKQNSLVKSLDILIGINTIPIMTIHKSKGLEYHTVIFVGLEDGAFWSFQNQPDEDKCAFFVALSRAKEKVVFTFSKKRKGKFGIESQTIKKIEILFEELSKSEVVKFEERKLE